MSEANLVVKLSLTDLLDVFKVSVFASRTDPELSTVCAIEDNNQSIRWIGTDRHRLATVARGTWTGTFKQFEVSVRDIEVALEHAQRRDASTILFEVSPETDHGIIIVDGIIIAFASGNGPALPIYEGAAELPAPDRYVSLPGVDLISLIEAAIQPPIGLAIEARKQFSLNVDGHGQRITAVCSWLGHSDTLTATSCIATANYDIAVEPNSLLQMISLVNDAEIRLESGPANSPVRIRTADGLLMLVMPSRVGIEADRPAFEEVLATFCDVQPSKLSRDADGDYPFDMRNGERLYLQLLPGDPNALIPRHVRFFTILAAGVASDLDTLEQINQQNQRVPFATMYLSSGGAVVLEASCLLQGVTVASIQTTFELVADLASKIGPWMRDFFSTPGTEDDPA